MFKAAVPKVGDRPPEGAAAITQGRSGAFYLIFCISATVGKVNSHYSALNKFSGVLKRQLVMCPGRGSRGRCRKRDLRETCFSSFFNFLHFFFFLASGSNRESQWKGKYKWSKNKEREWALLMGLFSAAALTRLFDFPLLSELVSPCVQPTVFGMSKRLVFSGSVWL